jgi:glycogen operon protein
MTDDSFLMGFNAHVDGVDFQLPGEEYSPFWEILVDTADGDDAGLLKAGSVLTLAAKSLVVLRASSGPETQVDYSAAASMAAMASDEDTADGGAPDETGAAQPSDAAAGTAGATSP